MPGFTYSIMIQMSHYDRVRRVYPMEYLDVVVNVGTVEAGNAAAPIFDLEVSNKFPSVGEFVSITARLPGQNIHDYGFSGIQMKFLRLRSNILTNQALQNPSMKKVNMSFDLWSATLKADWRPQTL